MDLEQIAIKRLTEASEISLNYYNKPLLLCYSGGKDSEVILQLAIRAGIPFEVQHSHTTIDTPETVYHVRKVFHELELAGIDCKINYPIYKGRRITMWDLIMVKKMPPTRSVRYCCQVLKETAGKNRAIITGVRREESINRINSGVFETRKSQKKDQVIIHDELQYDQQNLYREQIFLNNDNHAKRRFTEHCIKQQKIICNPIVDWSIKNVWEYISSENIKINPLYSCGFRRVGCLGCPMAGKKRWKEFQRYPKYKEAYIRVFDRMLSTYPKDKLCSWKNGYDVFLWWMEDQNIDGQIFFEDFDDVA